MHDIKEADNQLENSAQETNVTNSYRELKENSVHHTDAANIQLEVKKYYKVEENSVSKKTVRITLN